MTCKCEGEPSCRVCAQLDAALAASLDCYVLTNCRSSVTFRHGKLFAIEVWDENMNYYIIRQGEKAP